MTQENPLIPMGAVTGCPSREQLAARLRSFREQGVSQYLLYPRSGLETEYLSEEYFRICGDIIELCSELGYSSLWLYDEYNWPSGRCNGQVMKGHPEFELKYLAFRMENGAMRRKLRHLPEHVDLLSPGAVERFIELTHEEYARRFRKYFGTLIKGIFTDEPGVGYFWYQPEPGTIRIPWYDSLEEEYAALTGHELSDDLAAGIRLGNEFWRSDLNTLIAKRFRSTFVDRVAGWCAANGLMLTGHLMEEHIPGAAQRFSGSVPEVLSGFHLPGIDLIRTPDEIEKIEWFTLATAMYAIERNGNRGGLSELFALGPCDLTPTQIRRQLWLNALFGIDHYVLAVSPLDMRGNVGKPNWFNPYTPEQPWFELWRELGEDAADAARTAGWERDHRIVLRYPRADAPADVLLRELMLRQYDAALALPGESVDAACILSFTPEGTIREERSERIFRDPSELFAKLGKDASLRPVYVTEPDGTPVRDVFVRSFRNGAAVVLDFSGSERELAMHRYGVRSIFTLPPLGVVPFPGWQVESAGPNLCDLRFRDGRFEFTLEESPEELRLLVRNYPAPTQLTLDGVPVEAQDSGLLLPEGFRELYRQTPPLRLAKGRHLLTLENDEKDLPFLPPAYLAGTFAVHDDATFGRCRFAGDGLRGVTAPLIQRATLRIPPDAIGISVDPGDLGCELKVNGKSLGRRLWKPCRWLLPPELRGVEAEIGIVRYPSCAGMFRSRAVRDLTPWGPQSDVPAPFCEVEFLRPSPELRSITGSGR